MTDISDFQKSNGKIKTVDIPSIYIREIQDLHERIPVISDKALIDLVNGIQVSRDLIGYRNNQNYFGRLWNLLNDGDRSQLILDENHIVAQETLCQWVLDLTRLDDISKVALAETQEKLLEAREAIRRQQQTLERYEQTMENLFTGLNFLVQKVDERFKQQDLRIHKLEGRVDNLEVRDTVEDMVKAWNSGRTYKHLGWAVQVTLLSREVFTKVLATNKLEPRHEAKFRKLLIDEIIESPLSQNIPDPERTPNDPCCLLADLLDDSWSKMENKDRKLSAALLEVRSIPQQRLLKTPLLFTIGTTLELATLPSAARPQKPARCAMELCKVQIKRMDETIDRKTFVENIVQEIANDCMGIMVNRPIMTN